MSPDEMVFTVSGGDPTPAAHISLEEAGLRERQHLQEWVIRSPTLLGPDVMIVATEFGRWTANDGTRDADRLDVLALTREGQLVVAELKRGPAPHTTDMQALNYAARVHNFTLDRLATVHANFLTSRESPTTPDEAREALRRHAPTLDDDSVQGPPRIILMASEFGVSVSSTVVFLRQTYEMDVRLVRFQAYRTGSEEILVTASQIFPPPQIEDFMLFPDAEVRQERQAQRRREANTVTRLLAVNAISPGTRLFLHPGGEVSATVREQMEIWLLADPTRREATWQDDSVTPLVWTVDGEAYSPTGLVKRVVREATGLDIPSVAGPRSWQDSEGHTLPEIASSADALERRG